MVKAFYIVAGIDAVVLATLFLLNVGSLGKGGGDGGREMGFLFFILLPALVLAAVCALFVLVPVSLVRWLCLAVVVGPGAFLAYIQVGLTIQRLLEDPGAQYKDQPAMAQLVRAVDKLDVEGVRKWAPQQNKQLDQAEYKAPLRLLCEKVLEAKKRQVNPPLEAHYEIARILVQNGANANGAIQFACWSRSAELLRIFFAGGADPNFESSKGSRAILNCLGTAMIVADGRPALQAFIDAGADFRSPTAYGTPAAYAASSGDWDAVFYLLDQGVDPKTEDLVAHIETHLASARKFGNHTLDPKIAAAARRIGLEVPGPAPESNSR